MKKQDRNALVALPVVVVIAALFALAGSQGGTTVGGLPVFALCVILAFVIQWAVFVPSYLLQTERFFDLTGGLTYVTVAVVAVLLSEAPDARAWLLAGMVAVWAVRLSSYLFLRIRRSGADKRFDDLKPSFPRFLNTWTLQGLWVTITASAALAAITSTTRVELGTVTAVGLVLWVVGFGAGDHRRRPEERLPLRSRQQGALHQHRPLVLVAPPQLLRRDPPVGRGGRGGAAGAARLAVGHAALAGVRLPVAHPHQRRPASGEERRRALGRAAGLRGVQGTYVRPGAATTTEGLMVSLR